MNFCLFKNCFGFLSFLLLAVSLVDGIGYYFRLALLVPYVLSFLVDVSYLFSIVDLDRHGGAFMQYLFFSGLGNFLVVLSCVVLFRAERKRRGDIQSS